MTPEDIANLYCEANIILDESISEENFIERLKDMHASDEIRGDIWLSSTWKNPRPDKLPQIFLLVCRADCYDTIIQSGQVERWSSEKDALPHFQSHEKACRFGNEYKIISDSQP